MVLYNRLPLPPSRLQRSQSWKIRFSIHLPLHWREYSSLKNHMLVCNQWISVLCNLRRKHPIG